MNASANQFQAVRVLTLPTVKFEKGASKYLRFDEPIHAGSVVKGAGERARAVPVQQATVTDLQTGQKTILNVPPTVEVALTSSYPNSGYVGLSFEITKHNRRVEKGFPDFSVTEVKAANKK